MENMVEKDFGFQNCLDFGITDKGLWTCITVVTTHGGEDYTQRLTKLLQITGQTVMSRLKKAVVFRGQALNHFTMLLHKIIGKMK